MSAKVVTFGEIMLRLKSPAYERLMQSPVLEATFGGGEANVSVSLANYGLDTAFVTVLPDNDIGKACMRELRGFGVDTSKIVYKPGRMGIYYLENTLKEISELDSMVAQMSRAWKTGDDSLMVQVLNSGKKADSSARDSLMEAESDRRVYKERNEKMAVGIARFLSENRKVFVVVGAAHLVLDQDNVIELLRRLGLKVERF